MSKPRAISLAARGTGRPEDSKMIAEPRRKTLQDDAARDRREQLERALDEALANTFPASDPVSAEQPVPPAAGS